ncbi:MAG: BtpA/SgcQ family protein [Candidatus Eisenbacteria bacterium]|nr:BtpA/SgcQ family protein [Candidatus Eisenbacteria bacterium]MCC7141363.1 BtpA/SgcQ family protein [Candidatus Eisenbacteria bacterium]
MIHLQPLPGSPRYEGSLEVVLARARDEAQLLVEEGVDGLMVENFGDAPFYPDEVPPITIAAMTRAVSEVIESTAVPVGVNVLRNDGRSAIAIAAATGAQFIRVNVLTGATVTDQGLLQGRAHDIARLRAQFAPEVAIFADVRVKHGRPLAEFSLADEIADLVERGGADAVLLTGARTGEPPDLEFLAEARRAARGARLWIASGASRENVAQLAGKADGAIVGTSWKRDGETTGPIDRSRVRAFLQAAQGKPAGGRR